MRKAKTATAYSGPLFTIRELADQCVDDWIPAVHHDPLPNSPLDGKVFLLSRGQGQWARAKGISLISFARDARDWTPYFDDDV